MPILSNARHERFAQGLARGLSADEAYSKAGYVENRGNAARMNANESIKARVNEIQGKAEARTVLTIAEKREFCARVVRAHGGKLNPKTDADLINGVRYDKRGRRMLLLPDKLKAIQIDNDLAVDGAEAEKNKAIEIVIRKL